MQKDWKSILTKEEFFVCRNKGTEPAFSGTFNKFYKDLENGLDLSPQFNPAPGA